MNDVFSVIEMKGEGKSVEAGEKEKDRRRRGWKKDERRQPEEEAGRKGTERRKGEEERRKYQEEGGWRKEGKVTGVRSHMARSKDGIKGLSTFLVKGLSMFLEKKTPFKPRGNE